MIESCHVLSVSIRFLLRHQFLHIQSKTWSFIFFLFSFFFAWFGLNGMQTAPAGEAAVAARIPRRAPNVPLWKVITLNIWSFPFSGKMLFFIVFTILLNPPHKCFIPLLRAKKVSQKEEYLEFWTPSLTKESCKPQWMEKKKIFCQFVSPIPASD